MLAEWLERWLSGCPLYLREMGCLREALGIRRRWRRFGRAWEPHCRRSRELVLASAARCPRRRKALVLGSGWLHDVPLAELSRVFAEVVLVDLFHPLLVRWRARRYRNVRLLAADVTGTLEEVWAAGQVRGSGLPRRVVTLFTEESDLDFTVSLNLLSQLPCIPERYLLRCGRHGAAEVAAYCRGVVEEHLAWLVRLPGRVALVSDVEVLTVSQMGEEVARQGTLYGAELPWRGHAWDWTLVPRRNAWPHHAEVLRVVGVEDVKTG
jgi:hypothetical protein